MYRYKLLLLAVVFLLGCSGVDPAEAPDPDALPKAVLKIERVTEEVLTAFEEDRPKEADAPMHTVGHTLANLTKLAGPLGLNEEQKAALSTAVESLLDGFAKLHEPMHSKVFLSEGKLPEDFDTESIAEDLREGLEDLRAALPPEVLKRVEALSAPKEGDEQGE